MAIENEKKDWQWLILTLFNITLIYKGIPFIGLLLSIFLVLNHKHMSSGFLKIVLIMGNVISFFLSLYYNLVFFQTLITFLPGWLENFKN